MSDFVDYLHELLSDFGPIEAKKMFGGHGVFRDGLMFGLVADDTLYLKVDDESLEVFEDLNLGPFEYEKKGKLMQLSYYEAPPDCLENPEEATRWARIAYEAALRSRA